jgi:hypothetical protein
MSYLIVVQWGENDQITKMNSAPNLSSANGKVTAAVNAGYTDAFHVADFDFSVPLEYITVNEAGDDVIIDTATKDSEELAAAKTLRKQQAQELYVQKRYADFTYDTGTHSNDETYHMGKQTQFELKFLCDAGGSQDIYTKDDYVETTLTNAALSELCGKVMDRTIALAAQMSTHAVAIDALTTVSAVEAYDITTGW